jgi:hypothetical protein
MSISIGNKVRWSSAAGILTGKVDNIQLDLNGAGELIPWMTVRNISPVGHSAVRLCATDGYLKQLKVEVLNG